MARILIVDDERFVRVLLEATLKAVGHKVTLASDGNSAMNLFAHGSFDLVTTDLNMSGMDGLELCRAIKASSPSLPILMIASSPSVPLLADAFLAKPFVVDDLAKAIDLLLKKE